MSQNQKKQGSRKAANVLDSSVFLLIVIAIFVVLNVLVLWIQPASWTRTDLTRDQLFTLSPASKAMVEKLEEPMEVRFFITENLQYPDHNLETRVADLLTEYQAASGGKLEFKVIHPEEKKTLDKDKDLEGETAEEKEKRLAEEKEAEARAEQGPKGFGCQKIPVGQRGEDQVALRLVYRCMALVYGDKTEVINEVKGTDNLEYEISKRVKLLTTPEESHHKVGFVTGYGGPAAQPQFIESLNQAFSGIYGDLITCEPVDLSTAQKVPDGIDALVILNPTQAFSDSAKFAVDQFLMSGKGVAWMQTTLGPDERAPQLPMRKPIVTGLEKLFETYGVKLNSDLVIDRTNNIVSLMLTERGLAQISNPAMPIFTNINKEHVITRDVPTMAFPLASSITILPAALENPEIKVVELIRTEKEAAVRANASSIDYESLAEPNDSEVAGAVPVAVALQGPMASFYATSGKPAAAPASNPADGFAPEYQAVTKAPTGARVVVVSSGEFMFPNPRSGFSRQYSGLGALFLLNMIDWLVQDEDLITIRAKGIPSVLEGVDSDEHATYQVANAIGVPVLFVLFGVVFWFVRRNRRRSLTL
jgi:ABC-2 type transport system permease protein